MQSGSARARDLKRKVRVTLVGLLCVREFESVRAHSDALSLRTHVQGGTDLNKVKSVCV